MSELYPMKYEYKYPIPVEHLDRVRSLILPFLARDENMDRGTGKRYTVRSIYFDTPEYTYFNEKIEGLRERKKLRTRGYNECSPESTVYLEIKRKKDKKIWKYRAGVRRADLASLLESGDCERYVLNANQSTCDQCRRFLFHFYRSRLLPTALVVYDREAYFGKYDRTFRVTLDCNLRGSSLPTLEQIAGEDRLCYLDPRNFVMEVKFLDVFPSWMKDIVTTLELQRKAFSKYGNCILHHSAQEAFTSRMARHVHWHPTPRPCMYSGERPSIS
jgi:hypothetical protein